MAKLLIVEDDRRTNDAHGHSLSPQTITFGDVTVDFSGYTARDSAGKIDMSPREINLLRLLVEHKIFLYTMSIMIFIVIMTHGLICLLAPRMQLAVSTPDDVVVSIRQEQFVTEAVEKALPITLSCSLFISVACSLLFSKAIADPIKMISASTGQMMKLDRGANCPIHTKDEIGTLAQNVNELYSNLLSTIEHLEREKDAVQDMERAKVDFLRAASHELKTPVTALNATLENMILVHRCVNIEVIGA